MVPEIVNALTYSPQGIVKALTWYQDCIHP